jgi:dihydrodipicolinate synthase/N-acetylneuraminate lyase
MGGCSGSVLASGVFAALLTPRQPESTEADAGRLLEYLDRVSAAGVNGLVFFGSTGEFVHFDLEERIRVVTLAAKRSRLPVLVNVSHSALPGAVNLAEQAASAGAAGLLLMPPYFYRFSDGIIAEFYEQFVKAVGKEIPLYLYNLPQAGAMISPELADRLLTSGSFAGIKDSSTDGDLLQALLRVRERHPFRLLVGSETVYVPSLSAGADGAVSGVAAAIPELVVTLYRCIKSGDTDTTKALSARLDELMSWVERLSPIPALKQIAEMRSWLPFTLAVPLDENSKRDMREYRKWLEEWLPATLAACAPGAPVRT